MKAHKFVAEKGIEKAKAVLEGAPKDSLYLNQLTGFYYKIKGDDVMYGSDDESKGGWVVSTWPIEDLGRSKHAVSLEELKQVVESFEIVERWKDIQNCKDIIEEGASNQQPPEKSFAARMITAIADYEAVEAIKENQHV